MKWLKLILAIYSLFLISYYFINQDRVIFYDVGQGDASLILYQGVKILIDGGPNYNLDTHLSSDIFFRNCHFNLVVLSHPHADHLSGLHRALERCTYKKLWFDDLNYKSKLLENFKQLIQKNFANVNKGDFLRFNDVKIYVIWPEEQNYESENINNSSIVVLVKIKSFEILYMGDLEVESIKLIDTKNLMGLIDYPLEIYKVSHHGALNGHYLPFLLLLKPKSCVISVGENSYGHPNATVLSELSDLGCTIYRTDQMGSIEFLLE